MGCLKLTYQTTETPLKVVYKKPSFEQNNAQRFMSVDPLAHKFPAWSPYNFTMDNPINLIDPDGRAAEPPVEGVPIYTDNTGTYKWNEDKGKYYHEETKSYYQVTPQSKPKGKATYTFNGEYGYGFKGTFVTNPGDADYDLKVTNQESYEHFNSGSGEALLEYTGRINFKSSGLKVSDFAEVGDELSVNFFNFPTHLFDKGILFRPAADFDLSQVYGTLRVKLLNAKNGAIKLMPTYNGAIDIYDFSNPIFKSMRTRPGNDNAQPFRIYGFGKGSIWTK